MRLRHGIRPGGLVSEILRGWRETEEYAIGQVFPTTLTAAASNNAKGSYAALDASVNFDADGFHVYFMNQTASRDWLVDIAVGGAGAEVDILSNVLFSGSGFGFFDAMTFYCPLPLKAGTRVAARCQSTNGSAAMYCAIHPVAGEDYRARRKRRATTYGAATGDTGGVSIDPGGVANTYGSYVQISAGIANPIEDALIIIGNQRNGARTAGSGVLTIGAGGAGSEVTVVPDLQFQMEGSSDMVRPSVYERQGLRIPAGTRIAAKTACQVTDATDRLIDVCVIGFN